MYTKINKMLNIKLSGKSVGILRVISGSSGITAKEIQKILNIKSGNTFSKHVKPLLDLDYIEFHLDSNDKRHKKFYLKEAAHKYFLLAKKLETRASLDVFLRQCEHIYKIEHPELNHRDLWFDFYQGRAYSDEFVDNLKEIVFKNIKDYFKKKSI